MIKTLTRVGWWTAALAITTALGQEAREPAAISTPHNTLTLAAGGNYGVAAFGSHQAHHLALASLSYGRFLTDTLAPDRWYAGAIELRGELFGGPQFSPEDNWLIGLTPHVRYDFLASPRWIPFLDLGAGVAATGIGEPDLGSTFEFNLQAGLGLHYRLSKSVALTLEARYLHISCAGISQPNSGVNGITALLGITRFF